MFELRKLSNALKVFKSIRHDWTVNMIHIFISVSENEGLSVTELALKTNNDVSHISALTRKLEESGIFKRYSGKGKRKKIYLGNTGEEVRNYLKIALM